MALERFKRKGILLSTVAGKSAGGFGHSTFAYAPAAAMGATSGTVA